MKVLIDSNVLIQREDHRLVPENLTSLIQEIGRTNLSLYIHPANLIDIKKDKDEERRHIVLSKLNAYPTISDPPDPNDDPIFYANIKKPSKANDQLDDQLLYSLYKGIVNLFITEDVKIHKKARILRIEQSVLTIQDALDYIQTTFSPKSVKSPAPLYYEDVTKINIQDPIFEKLNADYGESKFKEWWETKVISEQRKPLIYRIPNTGLIGACLLTKIEDEKIYGTPELPRARRLKICTFIVTHHGHKIGELFIKKAIEEAIKNGINEIYFTHFSEENDHLIELSEEYGFKRVSHKSDGEEIYLKSLLPDKSTMQTAIKDFYPVFYDGKSIRKFIVPIKSMYHARLFPEFEPPNKIQQELPFGKELVSEGNTIKKAYVCLSKIQKIQIGDLLIFYSSTPISGITTIALVDEVFNVENDLDSLFSKIGKRTVYSRDEIQKSFSGKNALVLLFSYLFHFEKFMDLKFLKEKGLLRSAPQSILEIPDDIYLKIKHVGLEKYGRFAIN